MPNNLCLTIRFLQPYSHGRGGDGEPEWPPSPLRVFQALVAAAAARWNERMQLEYAAPALRWLECQKPPAIVAVSGVRSEAKYRLYVPDNVADKVAKSWSAGREASIADYRTEKDVRPTHLAGEAVHYLFPLADAGCPYFDVLAAAARRITHVGWGVDMVAADAAILSDEEAADLRGERWQPAEGASANSLRVPVEGTLDDLARKHTAFLNRLSGDGFRPVPPLSAYRVVGYRRATDPAPRPYAAFELWQPLEKLAGLPAGKSKYRPFDPVRDATNVATMVQHAVGLAAKRMRPLGWGDADILHFVYGHTPDGKDRVRGDGADRRFLYLPLPTINPLKVESIRRVLVVGPPTAEGAAAIDWVRKALAGQELVRPARPPRTECEARLPEAMLSPLSSRDWHVQEYVRQDRGAQVWSTVTPVVLPGYDDTGGIRRRLNKQRDSDAQKRLLERLERRTNRLLQAAFIQAGLPRELIEVSDLKLEWRPVGFRAGVDLAGRYQLPESSVKRPTYHVCVRFPTPIRGPLAIGAGRYRGLGLFAPEPGEMATRR
jgi:CRISPR-associated protein Csb2